MFGAVRGVLLGQAVRQFHTTKLVLAKIPIGNPEVQQQIGELVKKSKVVVFMKGDKEQPKCGFSNAVVQILRMHGVDDYHTVDVLQNEDIRQGESRLDWLIDWLIGWLSLFSFTGRSFDRLLNWLACFIGLVSAELSNIDWLTW